MLGSVLPFSPDLADRVSEYCEKHSEGNQGPSPILANPVLPGMISANGLFDE